MSAKKNIEKENEKMSAFKNEPNKTLTTDDDSMTGSLMDDFKNTGSEEGDEVVNMDTSDVYDEVVHPTGTECKLRIVSVDSGETKKGAPYWRMMLEDVNDPHIKRLAYFLSIIGPEDDVRRKNNIKKEFIKFKKAFGFAEDEPLSKLALPGREAWAVLRMKESEEYGEQNEVKAWTLPKGSGASGF
jgi:hypothetical protein